MSELLNSANLKLTRFVLDPKPEKLLTLAEWGVLGPYQKGYASYLMSDWDNSPIPAFNPYNEGVKEFKEFEQGKLAARQEVSETKSN
jgi:hypothetical protein